MTGPIHDFDAIGRSCLILGGIFTLFGLSGLAGGDASAGIRELGALGLQLPAWFPMSLFEHYRLLCAVQLLPNALMAVVGWGLLKKQPWSLGGLKLTAWLFLLGTVALGAWIVAAIGPAATADDPADLALRTFFVRTMVVTTAVMTGSVAWFLWRLRGARMAQPG